MTLTIYFKSKNVVKVKNVTKYEVGSRGDSITLISIIHKKPYFWQRKAKVLVQSIDMENIDCIIES
jgi:hypothetical protein